MKKTTYSKSFIGWVDRGETAKNLAMGENIPSKENPPDYVWPSKEECAECFSDCDPTKVRVTFIVTIEPLK